MGVGLVDRKRGFGLMQKRASPNCAFPDRPDFPRAFEISNASPSFQIMKFGIPENLPSP